MHILQISVHHKNFSLWQILRRNVFFLFSSRTSSITQIPQHRKISQNLHHSSTSTYTTYSHRNQYTIHFNDVQGPKKKPYSILDYSPLNPSPDTISPSPTTWTTRTPKKSHHEANFFSRKRVLFIDISSLKIIRQSFIAFSVSPKVVRGKKTLHGRLRVVGLSALRAHFSYTAMREVIFISSHIFLSEIRISFSYLFGMVPISANYRANVHYDVTFYFRIWLYIW